MDYVEKKTKFQYINFLYFSKNKNNSIFKWNVKYIFFFTSYKTNSFMRYAMIFNILRN